jgi:DNA polymerase-1
MVEVDKYLEGQKLKNKVKILLQVHDELVYEISEDVIGTVVNNIKKIMEGLIPPEKVSGIVCKTTIEVGDNWLEMEEI